MTASISNPKTQELPLPHCTVSTLTLTAFRNYASLMLDCAAKSVVLTGRNGVGKTNILEAVSLLAPGRGLRSAKLGQFQQQPVSANAIGWGVSAELLRRDDTQPLRIGTGQQPNGPDKRLIRIEGEPIKNQAELLSTVQILWQTPQMDGLFTQGSSERRHYYDRICALFIAEHSRLIYKYDHLRRERSKLLSNGRADAHWLASLERKMAELSIAIAHNRLEVMGFISQALTRLHPVFPQASLGLRGLAEESLQAQQLPAVEIEAQLAASLAQSRPEDAASGRASHGAHKLELEVVFTPKGVEAAYCSTGEQKALMLSLLLAQAEALKAQKGMAPIILLDEVIAHLDETRRAALFETLTALHCQCWMTGTEPALFSEFSAAHFSIENNQLREL